MLYDTFIYYTMGVILYTLWKFMVQKITFLGFIVFAYCCHHLIYILLWILILRIVWNFIQLTFLSWMLNKCGVWFVAIWYFIVYDGFSWHNHFSAHLELQLLFLYPCVFLQLIHLVKTFEYAVRCSVFDMQKFIMTWQNPMIAVRKTTRWWRNMGGFSI